MIFNCDMYYKPLLKEMEEKNIKQDRERLISNFVD